jgi:branched-chain amino acid transport system ATP-binding protein
MSGLARSDTKAVEGFGPARDGAGILEAANLCVNYGAIRALSDISIKVKPGEIVTLIGANGAGKTTTLRTISGLLRPAKGTVVFDGDRIDGSAPHTLVRRGLAQAPEGRGIFANLTVADNLDLGAYCRKDKEAVAADREKALTTFPRLRERINQNAGTLSGGEQQMLAIGRALMARPRVLLLDEPSLGLAPQIVLTIFKVIKDINAGGTTILLVEQNAHMALKIANYAYVLEAGRVVMADRAEVLEKSDEVRKAYLGLG